MLFKHFHSLICAVEQMERTDPTLCILLVFYQQRIRAPEQVLEGRSLTLTCQSDGAPPPTLVLSRNGAELHRENSTHFLSFNLSSAQLQDSAHYQCESTNQYGAARDARDISVRAPPRITSVLVLPSSVVFEGQNVTVCCSSVCAPPPSPRFSESWLTPETPGGATEVQRSHRPITSHPVV
uniref:Ig-like domain-containing protein n=1 Tax=Periophthalmus magnuspinnatus TaxID=409849 RepID=A0A3B3ZH80_9GOBI